MFKKSDVADIYNLTPMQAGILFHHQMDSQSLAYFQQLVYTATGHIDEILFEKALNVVIEKYDVFRTVFLYKKVQTPVQVVLKERKIKIDSRDISRLPGVEKKSLVEMMIRQDKEKKFDLEKDILMRVTIIKTADDQYKLIWSYHHIIMDGWCMSIIIKDFVRYYHTLSRGMAIVREKTPPYSSYLRWLDRQDRKKGLEFWQTYLEDYENRSSVPNWTRMPVPGTGEYKLEEYLLTMDDEVSQGLNRVAKENEVTLNIIFQVIWSILLQRYNNTGDVVFGAVVSGRPTEIDNIENIVGLFINTIPVRVKGNTDQSFFTFIKKFQEKEILTKLYEYLSLADIQNLTFLKRDLFDHILVFDNFPVSENIPALQEPDRENTRQGFSFSIEGLEAHEQTNYNFNIVIAPGNQITVKFSFNSLRYEISDIQCIASHFKQVATQIISNPKQHINRIEIITTEEKQRILYEFNNWETRYIRHNRIQELFEEIVEKIPDNIAVSSPEDLTGIYHRLESWSIDRDPDDKMKNCCFKQNPYIFQSRLRIPGQNTTLKILKTHRHNSVLVNDNMWTLLEFFDGTSNLKSIYSWIKKIEKTNDNPLEFLIYTIYMTDLLEVTFAYNRQPEIFILRGIEDLVSMVKFLYGNHIIKLAGISTEESAIPSSFIEEFGKCRRVSSAGERILPGNILTNEKELAKAQVLLLGDTPGLSTTGLLYLASYLKRNGISACCQYYDPGRDYESMKKNIENLLDNIQPAIVAISLKWFLYIARVIDMCRIIKEYSRRKGIEIRVVVGGNTASYFWEEIIKYDCIDYLVRGDGEEPLLGIARNEEDIPNCVYRQKGEIVQTPLTYVQDETDSPAIYLSNLEEILISPNAPIFGTFFVYTQKGCAMNCLYCGGCHNAQQKTFNRKKVLRRRIQEVRKDIKEVQKYTSTFHFEFDILDEHLFDYCKQIWEDIDLSGHFCLFTTLKPPAAKLVELVSRTFKYVYWDIDICTPSERHRKQLYALGLVKPQPSDEDILDFMATCEGYPNIEVRPNLITGLPYFTSADIEPGRQLLNKIINTYSCFGELHWARLHAQPGAPIIENFDRLQMNSFAASFNDFLEYSKRNFHRDAGFVNIENFDYPYIYFKDDQLNSRVTNFYLETNKMIAQHTRNKQRDLILSNTLSYRQLDEKARHLAGVIKAKGIKRGAIVGLMMEPSIDIPVGILGIFKAGCAYMPIDPEFPVERIKYMLKDTNAAALVTTRDLIEKNGKIISWEGEKILLEPDNCPGRGEVSSPETIPTASSQQPTNTATSSPTSTCQVSPANLAYVIYTSGTTGKPKGVAIKHENLVNYVHWFSNKAGLTGKDKAILTTSFAFDLGYTVLYTSLLKGGELHVLPREIYLDTERLLRYIKQKEITYLKVTPSLFSVIINSPGFSKITCQSLRFAAMGGEPINVKDIEKAHSICSHLKIMNHYGPTEATIGCAATIIDFTDFEEYKTHPVIGKPIDNTGIYILGNGLELLPIGIPGELCISGAGVGRGYLNQPELTAEKFVISHLSSVIGDRSSNLCPNDRSNKYSTNDHLYRTGDLARWLPNGTIEFLGRVDNQVKVRGYRIELGEIEKRLKAHPRVEDAVVLVKEAMAKENTPVNGDKYLCAYIVPQREKFAFNTETESEKRIITSKDILDTIGQREDKTLSILSLFQKQVKANGDKVAVKSEGRILTYDSLDRLAHRVAGKIIEEYDDRYKLSEKERIRYKRQMLLHGWGAASQEKLKAATVFVAGAGGGASPTIMQLALMGIETIKVCDFDEVELSNLNRQFLHNEKRLGMNKALSAQIAVSEANPNVNVIPYTQKLTRENVADMVGDADIIFDMFDGPADKFILSEYAVARGIPHVIISMTDINAYTAVLHTPRTPCYHCIFDKKKLDTIVAGMQNHVENYRKNPLPVVATSLFISTGTAVNEALKILLGFKNPAYNKFFYFNQRGEEENLVYTPGYKAMTYLFSDHFLKLCKEQGFDWEIGWRGKYMEELEITPDPGCPVCGTKREEKTAAAVSFPIEVNTAGKEVGKLPQTVGILLDWDIHMASANIGTLKAGKTPVLLNPSASLERLCHILEDSEARVILTEGHLLSMAEKLRSIVNKNIKIIGIELVDQSNEGDGDPGIDLNPDPIACIIYPPDSETPIAKFYDVLLHGTGGYTFENTGNPMGPTSLSSELTDYLMGVLPIYMIPSHFVKLEKIPLTPNGKVDIKALPGDGAEEKGEERAHPCNETEEKLVEIWAEVLAIEKEKIGTNSNFFELGGHSLNATILIAKIHHEFDYRFPLQKIFETPNIQSISNFIRAAKNLSNLEIDFTGQEVMEIEV